MLTTMYWLMGRRCLLPLRFPCTGSTYCLDVLIIVFYMLCSIPRYLFNVQNFVCVLWTVLMHLTALHFAPDLHVFLFLTNWATHICDELSLSYSCIVLHFAFSRDKRLKLMLNLRVHAIFAFPLLSLGNYCTSETACAACGRANKCHFWQRL